LKGKALDYYEKWERDGLLKQCLKEIQELIGKNISQKEIASLFGMSEKTMYKLIGSV
jgi:AraC-like DNA-binding protein